MFTKVPYLLNSERPHFRCRDVRKTQTFQNYRLYELYFFFFSAKLMINFAMKKIISTPLIRENPVSRPNVPPIADNMSTNLAAVSFVISS